MSSQQNNGDDQRGRVLPFRRHQPGAPAVQAFGNLSAEDSPVPDIGKYARGAPETDDYAHRMKMNALAVLVLAVLIGGGMWIVDTMAQMRKAQDCALTGRRNCAPVVVPPEGSAAAPVNVQRINR